MTQQTTQAALIALILTGCSGMTDNKQDPATISELASCPSTPNCVSSVDAGRSHYIDPIAIEGDPDAAWKTLLEILDADRSITITASEEHYIRAEAKTRILRFTDDVEFLLNRRANQIEMRSASRVGYSDLGKNRKRLDELRSKMRDAGVARDALDD